MNFITATKARSKFFDIIKETGDVSGSPVTVTLDGNPRAVIIPFEEYESWLETLEILKDSKVMKEIRKSREDFKKKDYVHLDEVLEEEGYINKDKNV